MRDLTAITNGQRQTLVNIVLGVRARAREFNRICNDAIEALHMNNEDAAEQLQAVADECKRQWEAAGQIADTVRGLTR